MRLNPEEISVLEVGTRLGLAVSAVTLVPCALPRSAAQDASWRNASELLAAQRDNIIVCYDPVERKYRQGVFGRLRHDRGLTHGQEETRGSLAR